MCTTQKLVDEWPKLVDEWTPVMSSIEVREVQMSMVQRIFQDAVADDSQEIEVDMLLADADVGSLLLTRTNI